MDETSQRLVVASVSVSVFVTNIPPLGRQNRCLLRRVKDWAKEEEVVVGAAVVVDAVVVVSEVEEKKGAQEA